MWHTFRSTGGASWKETGRSHVGAMEIDPVCAIGFGGIAYFGGVSLSDPGPGHNWLSRSVDGGVHWSAPSLLPTGDRDFIALDEMSKYRGRLYDTALYRRASATSSRSYIGEIRSIDSGASYLSPVPIVQNPPIRTGARSSEYSQGPIVVLRDGTVVQVAYRWPDTGNFNPIVAFASTDGGSRWSQAHVVATRAGCPLLDFNGYKQVGISVIPVVAADDSAGPFKNRVYVAWQSCANDLSPDSQAAIYVAHSDDDGKKWSEPVEADDSPVGLARKYPQVFAPAIAVNDNGIVAVTWYDSRDLPDGIGGQVRMAVSGDGGDVFSRSFLVAAAPSVLAPSADRVPLDTISASRILVLGVDTNFHVFGQDTVGLAADASGRFHPLWVDNRTGVAQLWTDTVEIAERAAIHGDPGLEDLRDVSGSVALNVRGATYDRGNETATADVALVNISRRTILGPIRIRVTRLTSWLGKARLQRSDNGLVANGAILTFVPAKGRSLSPGAATRGLHLVFHFDDLRPINPDDVVGEQIDYVSFKYVAYAPRARRQRSFVRRARP